jgi:tetratricopeptide (TPR) repeat protein
VTEHISRKDLKTDEFRETIAHGAEEIVLHKQGVAIFLGAAIVILAAVLGWRLYTDHQTVKSAAAYDDAMKSFKAPLHTVGMPADSTELTYADDKTKYDDAAKKFESVAQKYPHTRPGQISAYYAGLSLAKNGHNDDAVKWLDRAQSSGGDDVGSLAKLELAQLDDATSKPSDAEKIYQDLIAHPTVFVPKPVAMLALADHYRTLSKPADAAKLYNQIKTEFPDTNIATQATQSAAMLPGQS